MEPPTLSPREEGDAWTMRMGRFILYVLAFWVPLAFCRETHYVFQIKTLLTQAGGMALLIVMALDSMLSRRSSPIWNAWLIRALVLLLMWQAIKSWDSISPTLSWREFSRTGPLICIAIAVPYFFIARGVWEKLITVICWSAVLTTLYAALIHHPSSRETLFSPSESKPMDLVDVPLVGGALESLFYPEAFSDVLEKKQVLREQKGDPIVPLSSASFFPGKPSAGTFGNKNFLAGYLNLCLPLLIWRCWTLWRRRQSWIGHLSLACFAATALMALTLILLIGNRGSWLGLLGSTFFGALIATLRLEQPRLKRRVITIAFSLLLGCLGAIAILNPQRLASVVSFTESSNELRALTWASTFQAWVSDDEWEGFENPVKRWLTGFGHHSFRVFYPKVRSERVFKIEFDQHNSETSHPHNDYLGFLSELGLIGLLMNLAIPALALAMLWKRREQTLDPWVVVLLLALGTMWIHRSVSVGWRYTGLEFQGMLILGLICAASPPSPAQHPPPPRTFGVLAPLALLVCLAYSWSSIHWPIRWFQAQHFLAQGQIHYHSVQEAQRRRNEHSQAIIQARKASQNWSAAQKKEWQTTSKSRGEKNARMLGFYSALADRYYRASGEADPAHGEALYIGANMNTQLAAQSLDEGEWTRSRNLFLRALQGYEAVEEVFPYFVQVHYWKGACEKGIAQGHERSGRKEKAEPHYHDALLHFERYEREDPIYRELHLDRFTCLTGLGQHQEATDALIDFLQLTHRAGYPLFDARRRYDTRVSLGIVIKHLDGAQETLARDLYALLLQHESSACLLPSVPKTERHVKNAFRWLHE